MQKKRCRSFQYLRQCLCGTLLPSHASLIIHENEWLAVLVRHRAKQVHELTKGELRQDSFVVNGRADELLLSLLHCKEAVVHAVLDFEASDVCVVDLADAVNTAEGCNTRVNIFPHAYIASITLLFNATIEP